MTTEARAPESVRPPTETRTGRVLAVCAGKTKAFPKVPLDRATVGPDGIVGDGHAGAQRWSNSQRKLVPNDRAISVVGDEARREVNGLLGLDLQPGDFNENILVEGLGDLADLAEGDRLIFSSGVELRITAQNPPCKTFEGYGGAGLIKATSFKDEHGSIHNKRGVVATVVTTGELAPGDTVVVRSR